MSLEAQLLARLHELEAAEAKASGGKGREKQVALRARMVSMGLTYREADRIIHESPKARTSTANNFHACARKPYLANVVMAI